MFDEPLSTKQQLLEHLESYVNILANNSRLKAAFEEVDRADFVTSDYQTEAYEDYPLPIGSGQTISQPTTVAFMLEKLDPRPGDTVLDVGSGSGWTTALLSHLVGKKGRVIGVENISELVEMGKQNLEKYSLENASIRKAGDELGVPELAPYDRILVSAAAESAIPEQLVSQLKNGGRMVLPVDDTLIALIKHEDGSIEKSSFPGFAFVPLR